MVATYAFGKWPVMTLETIHVPSSELRLEERVDDWRSMKVSEYDIPNELFVEAKDGRFGVVVEYGLGGIGSQSRESRSVFRVGGVSLRAGDNSHRVYEIKDVTGSPATPDSWRALASAIELHAKNVPEPRRRIVELLGHAMIVIARTVEKHHASESEICE